MKKFLFVAVPLALWAGLALAFAPYNVAVTMQSGEALAAAVTGATGGAPVTVLTPTKDCAGLHLENTTNVELTATLGGVKFKRVPTATVRIFDLGANGARIKSGTVIGVYPSSTNPSSGAFEAVCTPTF